MTKILAAKPIVDELLIQLTDKTKKVTNLLGRKPKMAVVLVGNNPASLSYIKNKKQKCEEVGAEFQLVQLDENTSEEKFIIEIKNLNTDNAIDGFIIQMPVPKQLKHLDLMNMVNPVKDIDGFHIENIHHLYANDNKKALLPCTPKGIVKMCDFYGIELSGKNIIIIGRSLIVGKPLFHIMSNKDATVTLCHSKSKNIKELCKNADIIITAIGVAKFLTKDFINSNKNQTIIDVGMNTVDGKLCGDCDFENIKEHVNAITPVPGGVGPMTVISLISNLLNAADSRIKNG